MLHVAEGQAAVVPQPQPILITEWDKTNGPGGTIGFLSSSEEAAREIASAFGEVRASQIRESVFAWLYELQICPLYGFDDVLEHLCQIAGPTGILIGW